MSYVQDYSGKCFLNFDLSYPLKKTVFLLPSPVSIFILRTSLPLPTFHLWPLKVWLMLGRWGNINIASNAIFANCSRSRGEGHILSFDHHIFWVECFHFIFYIPESWLYIQIHAEANHFLNFYGVPRVCFLIIALGWKSNSMCASFSAEIGQTIFDPFLWWLFHLGEMTTEMGGKTGSISSTRSSHHLQPGSHSTRNLILSFLDVI